MHRIEIDAGYVELFAVDGSEQRIVEIARLSHDSVSKGEEHDKRLLKSLLKKGHLSPFEFASLIFKIECPLFVARQLMRYRTGSYNEKSRRYTTDKPKFWIIPNMKEEEEKEFYELMEKSFALYNRMLKSKKPEIARSMLLQGMYTTFYVSHKVRNLLHIFDDRLKSDAQNETRKVVQAIYDLTYENGFSDTLDIYFGKEK